jgi:hypothetical protein
VVKAKQTLEKEIQQLRRKVATATSANSASKRVAPVAPHANMLAAAQALRSDVNYAQTWRRAGCPEAWPTPRPVFSGPANTFRYINVHAVTNTVEINIGAGATVVVMCNPFALANPVWADGTTWAGTSYDFSREGQ